MEEEFERYIRSGEIMFKYAKGLYPQPGKEIHLFHEFLFFLGTNTTFICESGAQPLQPNTLVIIPKETFHQFHCLSRAKDYTRCVFNFNGVAELDGLISRKVKQIQLIQSDTITRLFAQLAQLTTSPLDELDRQIMMKALFAQILVHIECQSTAVPRRSGSFHPLTNQAIDLINTHINKSISIPELAARLNVSESHLAHVFKQDMHLSLYQYILHKRLILTNHIISGGVSPLQAAAECGFNDYSGFYRQYKKLFGYPPSMTGRSQRIPEPK